MSTQTASLAPGYDISSDVERPSAAIVEAAGHLVDFRDGLFAHFMWLAEQTSELSAPDQALVFERLLVVLGQSEARRRAAQISVLATPCWGIFREVGAQRIASVEILRGVLLDTATAVRDEFHCICREAS